jgi:hypothetical protein
MDDDEEFRRAFLREIGEDEELESSKPQSVLALLNTHARSAVGNTAPPRSSLLKALAKPKPLQVRALFCVFSASFSHDFPYTGLGRQKPQAAEPSSHHQVTSRGDPVTGYSHRARCCNGQRKCAAYEDDSQERLFTGSRLFLVSRRDVSLSSRLFLVSRSASLQNGQDLHLPRTLHCPLGQAPPVSR